jgi:hypothetical protein
MRSNRPYHATLAVAACLAACCAAPRAARAASHDELAERRARILALSPAEKEQLLRRHRRLNEDAAQREQLRKLDRDLRSAPDREALVAVMHRYHEWLKTLHPARAAELKNLPPAEKLAKVKQWRGEQALRKARDLSPQDKAAVVRWLIANRAPAENRQRLLELSPDEQLLLARRFLLARMAGGRSRLAADLSAEEVQSLLASLSPQAGSLMAAMPGEQARKKLAAQWIWQTLLPKVTREELMRFFESLPAEQKRRLESLPQDESQRQLRRLYLREQDSRPQRPLPPRGDRPLRPGRAWPGGQWSRGASQPGEQATPPDSGSRPD